MTAARHVSAALGVLLAATTAASAAPPDLAAYQGAWVEQNVACDAVFAAGPKGLAFRKPVDLFAPAFILSGNRIRTPQASCRITAVRRLGDRDALTLSCSNAVSVSSVTALLARAPDGTLKRFFDGKDTIGTSYARCMP
jgi:hypothetical protein